MAVVNKRRHPRWPADVLVKYKFISKDEPNSPLAKIYEGSTRDIGRGGMLLAGTVPNPACMSDLLSNKILVGLNFYVPTDPTLIKVLSQVAWIKAVDARTLQHTIGLKFLGLSADDGERIAKYIVHLQIKGRKKQLPGQPEDCLRI